jgi:hypothetical protein
VSSNPSATRRSISLPVQKHWSFQSAGIYSATPGAKTLLCSILRLLKPRVPGRDHQANLTEFSGNTGIGRPASARHPGRSAQQKKEPDRSAQESRDKATLLSNQITPAAAPAVLCVLLGRSSDQPQGVHACAATTL